MPIKDLINASIDESDIKKNIFRQIADEAGIVFFSEETKKLMRAYSDDDQDAINKLWKEMLVDSICILKMNDSREKLYDDTKKLTEKSKVKINSPSKKQNPFSKAFSKIRQISSYGIDNLGKYFDAFVDYETVLYGTDNYYRDHVKHLLQVWAIGISILHVNIKSFVIEKSTLSDSDFHFQLDPSTKGKDDYFIFSKSEIWAMWTIIALCHDLGYPIEKTSKINEKARRIINHFGCINFEELNFSFGLFSNFIVDKFLNIISSKVVKLQQSNEEDSGEFVTSIQSKYHDKLSKSLEEFKHGIFSSLLIFKDLTYFLETDYTYPLQRLDNEDSRQFLIRKEILRAIAAHTCPKLYHVKLNTLSFLLILCDELQEWGRPKFDDFRSSESSKDIEVELSKCEITTTKQEVALLFRYKKKSSSDMDKYIKDRFKHMHHLLRSAKDDKKREINFSWKVIFSDQVEYNFLFDSSKDSFDLISFTNSNKSSDKLY